MKKAGAGAPSANRITLLRDADGDGVAEAHALSDGLNSPFGMALVGERFLCRRHRRGGALSLSRRRQRTSTRAGDEVADLPAGPPTTTGQEHDRQPRRQQAVCDRRLEQQCRRERHGGGRGPRRDLGDRPRQRRRTASSRRACAIPNGLAWEPDSGRAVDGGQRARRTRQRSRARLPDLGARRRLLRLALQLLRPARRPRVKPQRPDLVATAIVPDYALGAHTASLGLALSDGNALPRLSARACSSASTARGTASRTVATR